MAKWDAPTDFVTKTYMVINAGTSAGQAWQLLECPFCNRRVKAYTRSLAGSGKRCECGALLSWLGNTATRDRRTL